MIIINQYRNQQLPYYILQEYWGELYFDEIFVPITEESIPDIEECRYMISNYGKVYDMYNYCRINPIIYLSNLERGNKHNKYSRITLHLNNGNKTFMLHRIIMASFYPELGNVYNEMDINHKDGVGTNNYISYNNPECGNIEWMSHRDNMLHAYRTGLHQVGEDNVHSIITEEEAKKVIELLALDPNKYTYTSKEIAEIVGGKVTPHIVDDIRKKEAWAYLSEGYNFYQKPFRQFTEQDIHNFCKYFQDNPKPDNMYITDQCRRALIACGFEPTERYVETLRKIFVKKYYPEIVSQYNF